ncbi:MAG: EpsD family peptidyl-prolyl cis-trans isomerase [Azoarcus sp.]|jgi:EpsD family peptidyl-prolyl cis-trans isomerase|nr:EpsD family peptidyl-prolyl cis-trans isomerase [Azoarcus sp.]
MSAATAMKGRSAAVVLPCSPQWFKPSGKDRHFVILRVLMFHSVRIAPLCVAVLLASAFSGCGGKENADKPASQVAVKVNKEEISVHQVNDLLGRGGAIPPDQLKNATAAAVERLINQELLVQQAKEHKLDRDPRVMQMIEFSRREILARAYAEQFTSATPRPSEAQIQAFYDENPALFAKRRIYSLQEINITASPEQFEEVRVRLQSGGSLQQLMDWLKEKGVQFAANSAIKAAEQLPGELLKSIAALNAGQAFATRTPTGAVLVFVVGARDEPVDRNRAKPAIENYLLVQARNEKRAEELKRLRESAAIEYVGEFTPSPAAEAAPAAQGQQAAPPATEEESKEDAIRSAIEQGAAKLR